MNEAQAREILLDFVRRYGPNSPLGELAAKTCAQEVFGFTLDPAQLPIARAFSRGERRIAARSCHGIGKAQPLDLVVPTPAGNRRWGDLRLGDTLWAADGVPTKITARYDHEAKPLFRVGFSDGSSTLTCEDHLWEVEELRRTASKAEWDVRVLDTGSLLREGLMLGNGPGATRRKFRLPAIEPVRYATQDVPAEPYLMGLWLGDGSTNGTLSNIDPEIHEYVERLGGAWRPEKRSGHPKFTGTVPGLISALRDLGVLGKRSWEKSIPRMYLENDVPSRIALLQGLMDTDGTVTPWGSASYCTVSRDLADDVMWLVRSLGGVAREGAVKKAFYRNGDGEKVPGRQAYNITITFSEPKFLFRVARKRDRLPEKVEERYTRRWIVSVEPEGAGDAMCVAVDNPRALYLTNDFIVTHNTTVAAILAWIHLLTRFPQKTAVTAPSKGQLEDAFFAEMEALYGRMPEPLQALFEIKKNHIELIAAPKESFLTAKTARKDNPEALQGIHSANVLLIADEASGVDEEVFEAGSGSMSGENATTLLLGNPTRTSGFFYDAFHGLADMWVRIHATAVPNTPGIYSPRVSPDYVEQIARTYGRDSNAFRIRCLGEFPLAQEDTIIPLHVVESAHGRDIITPKHAVEVWGLDVARFGGDENVLLRRNRLEVLPLIEVWEGRDLMKTTGTLKRAYDEAEDKPEVILIDEIGYGAGVLDRGRELGLPVRGVNVSERKGVDDQYYNLRTELWYRGLAWFEGLNRRLPERCTCGKCDEKDDHVQQLKRELTSLRYDYASSTGQLVAEPKKLYKKRTKGHSPNIADAFMLTLAGEASTLMHGSQGAQGGHTNLNKPLRRRRSIV